MQQEISLIFKYFYLPLYPEVANWMLVAKVASRVLSPHSRTAIFRRKSMSFGKEMDTSTHPFHDMPPLTCNSNICSAINCTAVQKLCNKKYITNTHNIFIFISKYLYKIKTYVYNGLVYDFYIHEGKILCNAHIIKKNSLQSARHNIRCIYIYLHPNPALL